MGTGSYPVPHPILYEWFQPWTAHGEWLVGSTAWCSAANLHRCSSILLRVGRPSPVYSNQAMRRGDCLWDQQCGGRRAGGAAWCSTAGLDVWWPSYIWWSRWLHCEWMRRSYGKSLQVALEATAVQEEDGEEVHWEVDRSCHGQGECHLLDVESGNSHYNPPFEVKLVFKIPF